MVVCSSCQQRNDDPSIVLCLGCGSILHQGEPEKPVTNEIEPTESHSGEAPSEVRPKYDVGDKDYSKNYGSGSTFNYTSTETQYCAAGDEEFISSWRKFRCAGCGRNPVCENHYDSVKKACTICQAETSSNAESPNADDGSRSKLDEIADQLEQDELVAINPDGNIVPRDELMLINGKLSDKDGNQVSSLKQNIWYARPRQWYQVRPKLVQREVQAMEIHPQMTLHTDPKFSGDAYWQGMLRTTTGNNYEIKIEFRRSFPNTPPKVWITNPKIPRSRHIYPDGHLCFFHIDDNTWQPKTTSATIFAWIAKWLHSYEIWCVTGEWPGGEHDQDVIEPEY